MKNFAIAFGFLEGIHKITIHADTEDVKHATDAELANLIRNNISLLKSKEAEIPMVSLT